MRLVDATFKRSLPRGELRRTVRTSEVVFKNVVLFDEINISSRLHAIIGGIDLHYFLNFFIFLISLPSSPSRTEFKLRDVHTNAIPLLTLSRLLA